MNCCRFVQHLSASSCLASHQLLSRDELNRVLGQSDTDAETDTDTETSVMLTVGIISGIPGSYKENVANFITKLTQERSRLVSVI